MRLYIFKSETTNGLHAFAGDPGGDKLPDRHAPWSVTGVVAADAPPPHNLSRQTIVDAVATTGFQLWRLKKSPK